MNDSDAQLTRPTKLFTLDGGLVEREDFIRINELLPEEVEELDRLDVGEAITYGGGAWGVFVLKRVS